MSGAREIVMGQAPVPLATLTELSDHDRALVLSVITALVTKTRIKTLASVIAEPGGPQSAGNDRTEAPAPAHR